MPVPPRKMPKKIDQDKKPLYCSSKTSKDNLVYVLSQPLARLNSEQKEALEKAAKFAMEQSIRMVLMKQTLLQQQQV